MSNFLSTSHALTHIEYIKEAEEWYAECYDGAWYTAQPFRADAELFVAMHRQETKA